jgi:hypothetical protein
MMLNKVGVYLLQECPKANLESLGLPIDIKSLQNRFLKVFYVPATSAGLNRLPFLLQP